MKSLRARLILAASLVLTFFIIFAGYALDRAFYDSAEASLQENLGTQLTLLLAGAEVNNPDDIDMPSRLLETKFSLPSSGLYAYILNDKGRRIWKSLSTVGVNLPKPIKLEPGKSLQQRLKHNGEEYYIKSNGILWHTQNRKIQLTFNIITDLNDFNQQIKEYRHTLWGWLIGLATILLVVQVIILIWGLKPLRRVTSELTAIESGEQDRITRNYPTEILRLTDNINGLLEHEHTQLTRYRNSLADLAHSLKTPLAVINGALHELDDKSRQSIQEQVQRMDNIISHQLQRAATAGSSSIRKSIEVKIIVNKISKALNKVYRDKNIQFDIHMPDNLQIRVDEGDIMEVLGNVMDNACKFCVQRVRVNIALIENRANFTIADDGRGIKDTEIQLILERGGRVDQAMPGQGIGLSVVMDIVSAYHSELTITKSDLGGAAFSFDFPSS
ncbi:Sensor histidine kinase PhoQ [hydrothermal vent metagenome]|uniref:histidine kinase n=1 Tax=hydrothermal vent metagenome TaxID=652676 RepID=A0A3B0ZNJ6_9ZZZZ